MEAVMPLPQDAIALISGPRRLTPSNVRHLRKLGKFTQKRLAQLLGVDKAVVGRWENGHRRMGFQSERLFRILIISRCADITNNDIFQLMRKLAQPWQEAPVEAPDLLPDQVDN